MSHKHNGFRRTCLASAAFTILSLFTLIATPATLEAQTGGQGAITGTVLDSTGAAVAGATVTATNIATNVATTRTTSSAGAYLISPLPPGVYR
jgi:hypothetical protein